MVLALIRMGIFGAAHGKGEGGHTNPTQKKLGTDISYLKKIQKI